jgi:glycosyltransferase involved in cell wall biosynthesis
MSMLEAMASGLVVVGTASGGSGEVLVHERTGLVFPKRDAAACAALVFRLFEDRALYNRLRHEARRAIEERFEMGEIMNRLETSLRSALEVER